MKTEVKDPSPEDFYLSITVDRSSLSPCITVSSVIEPSQSLRIPFNYAKPEFSRKTNDIIQTQILFFLGYETEHRDAVGRYFVKLYRIFRENEAFALETRVSFSQTGEVVVHEAKFGFDDAAYKSAGRQHKVHKLRDIRTEVPEEVKAEKNGIVYIK